MWYRKSHRRNSGKSSVRRSHGKRKNNLSLERLDDRRMLTVQFQFNAAAGTSQDVIQGFHQAGALWQSVLENDATVNITISAVGIPGTEEAITSPSLLAPVSYANLRTSLTSKATSANDTLALANLPAGPTVSVYINRTSDNPDGSGSATPYVDNDGGANNSTTTVTRANGKALGLVAANDPSSDGTIIINSNVPFDFDAANGIDPAQKDFVFVAAREIGKILGFTSTVNFLDGNDGQSGRPGPLNDDNFLPTVLDLFRSSPDSRSNGADLDLTADNRAKQFSIDDGTTIPATFSRGTFNGDGNPAELWFNSIPAQGIMDPTIANGESSQLTGVDLLALDVIGWGIGLDDELEPNNSIATATPLGSETEVTLRDLAISAGDNDFFQYTAHSTGQLIVNALFDDAAGDLNLEILDAQGNVLGSSTGVVDNETVIIPVVSGQKYFVRVFGATDQTVNAYALEVENFPTPVPTGVDLDPASDTGGSDSDNVTQDTTPTFSIQTGVLGFVDVDHDNVLDANEIDVLTAAQATAGTTAGIAVQVTLINTSDPAQAPVTGFADPLSTTFPTVYRFTPSAPLPQGVYLVSATTRIFDGQTPNKSAPSGPSIPLTVTIDTTAPTAPAPTLLQSSDSGTNNNDAVTNVIQPAFDGTAELRSKVTVFAQEVDASGLPIGLARVVGQGVVGSDLSDEIAGNGLGQWEVTVEPLSDGRYNIFTRFEDAAGVVSPVSDNLLVVIDTVEPNTPLLDLVTDSGRNSVDDLTNSNLPTVTMRGNATTAGGPTNPAPNDVIFRLYLRADGGITPPPSDEILVYDSSSDPLLVGGLTTLASLTRTISLTLNNPAGTPLPDGTYNLKLEVEDRAGNISHDFLLPIIVDSTDPPVSFGIPSALEGLVADSDTGSPVDPSLSNDLITSDTTPKFAGTAEANALVSVFADVNNNGALDPADQLVGQTTAIPLDGNLAEPFGYWEIQSTVDVNQIFGARDGLRRFFVTAIDPAGNETGIDIEDPDPDQILEIFVDTQGPQIDNIFVTGNEDFDLFAPKPQAQGPTPLVNQLSIAVTDLPGRIVPGDFSYAAVIEQLAETAGNYRLVGDFNGVIPITNVTVLFNPIANGNPGSAQIILTFAKPLPDDRYTLTVSDNITDPAGNKLDGENSSAAADGTPNFPSGDGVPGGSFSARFTVDSRPEIGIWSSSAAQLDINGNFLWDPTAADQTNRDLTQVFGNTSDYAFAGNFTDLAGSVEGFDKLGVYGRIGGQWQWRVDTNNDGVLDLVVNDPANINGFPIAGNYDNNSDNGDEVGVFDGANFWLDTNHDYQVDTKIASNLRGHPISGDFDGDGTDDLATYRNDTGDFQFNLSGAAGGLDGSVDATIHFDFPGVMQRPVAADMDQDGIDDIGLRVAGDNFAGSQGVAEWYFLISNQSRRDQEEDGAPAVAAFPALAGTVDALNHPFSPTPLGNDLFARFGDELGVPLVGNFDPPLTSQPAPPKVDTSATGRANTLVKSLYRDILGREADSSGLAYFTSQAVAGATSQQIATTLLASQEYYGKLVDSFYVTYLHRQADAGGRAAWVSQLVAGSTSDQIVASFLQSAEYASKNNGNAAFVDGLYRDILGRNADAGGRASWINSLNTGTSRSAVIAGFLGSQERRERVVDQVYRQMLNRPADQAGKQLYVPKLSAADYTQSSLEVALAASDDYFTKVYGKS